MTVSVTTTPPHHIFLWLTTIPLVSQLGHITSAVCVWMPFVMSTTNIMRSMIWAPAHMETHYTEEMTVTKTFTQQPCLCPLRTLVEGVSVLTSAVTYTWYWLLRCPHFRGLGVQGPRGPHFGGPEVLISGSRGPGVPLYIPTLHYLQWWFEWGRHGQDNRPMSPAHLQTHNLRVKSFSTCITTNYLKFFTPTFQMRWYGHSEWGKPCNYIDGGQLAQCRLHVNVLVGVSYRDQVWCLSLGSEGSCQTKLWTPQSLKPWLHIYTRTYIQAGSKKKITYFAQHLKTFFHYQCDPVCPRWSWDIFCPFLC